MDKRTTAETYDDQRPKTVSSIIPILSAVKQARAEEAEQKVISLKINEPLPLLRPSQRGDSFPIGALPKSMREAAECIHEVMQAPMDMICHSILASLSAAAQPYIDIEMDGRISPVSNNYLSEGDSGERKSALSNAVNKPILDRQKLETEKFKAEVHVNKIIRASWNRQVETAIKAGKTEDEMRQLYREIGREPILIPPIMILTDPTFQGLIRRLAEGRSHITLLSTEAGQFVGGYSMNKDNFAATVAGLSLCWDAAPITKSTATETDQIYGRRVTIILMLQPIFTPKLLNDPIAINQGLVARILCCAPESMIGHRTYIQKSVSDDPRIKEFYSRINSILDLPLPLHSETDMGLVPRVLHLTPAAKRLSIDFISYLEEGMKKDGAFYEIRDFASKANEHALREAAKLAFFENPDTRDVSKDAMESGVESIQFYLGEQLRLRRISSENSDLMLAQQVFDWAMQEKNGDGKISMKFLYQCGPNAVRSKKKAESIISILEEHNRAVRMDAGSLIKGEFRRDVWELRG